MLSDGSPWRPLIDVKDMADAMIWASSHQLEEGKSTLTINVGSNDWNFQISDLAQICGSLFSGTKININKEAAPDKRSYKVDFSMYKSLSSNSATLKEIETTVEEIANTIHKLNDVKEIYNSKYIRLNHVRHLVKAGKLIMSSIGYERTNEKHCHYWCRH